MLPNQEHLDDGCLGIVSSAFQENYGTLISKAHFDCEVDFILSVKSEGARPRIGREESSATC
jgi:hypothetical protein